MQFGGLKLKDVVFINFQIPSLALQSIAPLSQSALEGHCCVISGGKNIGRHETTEE